MYRISFIRRTGKLTGYGWTTVSNMDSLQLLRDKSNKKNNERLSFNKFRSFLWTTQLIQSEKSRTNTVSKWCTWQSCLGTIVLSFAAEKKPIQGHGSCRGVATWALFPVLMYCLQTAAQVTQGPKAQCQLLSCVNEINLMRRLKKQQHQHTDKWSRWLE